MVSRSSKPVEARSGFLGRPVLLVLIVSVALAIAFMVFTFVGTPKPWRFVKLWLNGKSRPMFVL
jgi:hypothetical protein